MIFRLVGVDRDHRHSFRRVVVVEFNHPVFAAHHVRAMIARKDHHQQLRVFEAGQRVVLSVYAGQVEVGCFLSDLKRECHDLSSRVVW
jgi:hypothetical protein